jgi:hypothetical protein
LATIFFTLVMNSSAYASPSTAKAKSKKAGGGLVPVTKVPVATVEN